MSGAKNRERPVQGVNKLGRSAIVVAGFILLAAGISPLAVRWHRAWLARQFVVRVSQSADDQVEIPIRQLARLGLPAIDPLVSIAASERAAPANAAQEVVSEMVAVWEIDQHAAATNDNFGIQFSTLASALARYVDRLSPTGRRWAERLALRILVHTKHLSPGRSVGVLADCQAILASIPPRGPRQRNLPRSARPAGVAELTPLGKPETDWDQLAATGQLVEPSPMAKALPRPTGLPAANSSRSNSPLPTRMPANEPRNGRSWLPTWGSPLGRSGLPSKPAGQGARRDAPPTGRTVSSRVLDVPTPEEMEKLRLQLQSYTLRELMAMLGTARGFEQAMVRAVARKRGVTDVEISLATLLASSKASDRLQILDELTQLPAANARRWLRWLLDDADSKVRLRALTTMATTGEPQLYELARQRAAEDTDPGVIELATKIIRSRQK